MSERPKVTYEMLVAAMRAFELMSSVLRYREKDKWHSCDMMGMRDAIRAAILVQAKSQDASVRALEKISGRLEYEAADHQAAALYKPEQGRWTTDEYLADAALG